MGRPHFFCKRTVKMEENKIKKDIKDKKEKKPKKRKHPIWFYDICRRRMFAILMLLLQLVLVTWVVIDRSSVSTYVTYAFYGLSVAMVMHVIASRSAPEYKLVFSIMILAFPLFGGIYYLLFRLQSVRARYRRKFEALDAESNDLLLLPGDSFESAANEMPEYSAQMSYLKNFANFPVYSGTKTKFLSPGEKFFEVFLERLRSAEKYIFLEYFIIHGGKMWDAVLEVLTERAAAGVDVRIIYDDMGCFLSLPRNYPKQLRKRGIHCAVFNPFIPVYTDVQNNRDHRKIAVIDGKVAFTGGINLADEYINEVERFGYWKDASVMIEGKAAWSFAVMFLRMWYICRPKKDSSEGYAALIRNFYPYDGGEVEDTAGGEGYVQPFNDSPLDLEPVGENIYLQIIYSARKYVYIFSPYLIIDDAMMKALTLSAKSGVDVRIITPHKPDKPVVHATSRSYYRELIENGVKIYEFAEGFLHTKAFVADDLVATVGTTNLDYRSLYLHFECGVRIYSSSTVGEIKQDFLNTLDKCIEIKADDYSRGALGGFGRKLLQLFAPLM